MDQVVQKLIALGVPGIIVLVMVASSSVYGAAAVVAVLATLGGPLGMMGGLALLGVVGLVAESVSKYGMEAIFVRVVRGLVNDGTPIPEIREQIAKYPISADLKRRINELLDQMEKDNGTKS